MNKALNIIKVLFLSMTALSNSVHAQFGLEMKTSGDINGYFSDYYPYVLVGNHLIAFDKTNQKIKTISLESYKLIGSLDGTVTSEGNKYRLAFPGYFVNGRYGLSGTYSYKDKATKNKYVIFALFPFKYNFSIIENRPLYTEKAVYVKSILKDTTNKYVGQDVIFAGENYSVFRLRKRPEKNVYIGTLPKLPYDVKIISNNAQEKIIDGKEQALVNPPISMQNPNNNLLREDMHYNEISLWQEESGFYFLFNNKNYLKQEWTEPENTIEIYDGETNENIVSFDINKYLKSKGRVIKYRILDNGDIVLGGVYGINFIENDKKSEEKDIQIEGFFRLVLNGKGEKISDESSTFHSTLLNNGSDKIKIDNVHIVENGGLFFVLTDKDDKENLDLKIQNLSVIGLMKDTSWVKSYPLLQNYPRVETNVAPVNWKHLGVHSAVWGNAIVIAYNDNKKNQETLDYTKYRFDKENMPEKYVCSRHSGITFLRVEGSGKTEVQFIDTETDKYSLSQFKKVNNNTGFVVLSGNKLVSGQEKIHIGTISINK